MITKRSGDSNLISYVVVLCLMTTYMSCDTAGNVDAPNNNYFVKYYGGDGNQTGTDLIANSDGTFLLLGNTEFNQSKRIMLVKTTADGNIIWQKKLGGSDIARDIEPTIDGNFIIVSDYLKGPDNYDIKLIKVNSDGDKIDSVVVGYPAHDYAKSITVLKDGGFIVSGTTEFTGTWGANVPDPDLGDIIHFRFNASLDQFSPAEWEPLHGFGGKRDVAIKMVERNNYFYGVGYSNSDLNNTNPQKKLAMMYYGLTSAGVKGPVYTPGNLTDDTSVEAVEFSPAELLNGYLVIGTSQNAVGATQLFVSKLRDSLTFVSLSNDAVLYTNIPITNLRGVSAASSVTTPQGFILLANKAGDTGTTNIWITKIDQGGQEKWSASFGSIDENDTAGAITELPDGRIAVVGTMGLGDSQTKMVLIKLNSTGRLLK
ncbi:MAG: hypothetical protein ACOYXT_00240 [Bacteroidota bacterium]